MAEIRNLTRNGETFYPLAHVGGLLNRDGNPVEIINDIFDISEYNASGDPRVPTKYSTFSSALAAIPEGKQKGGMAIRYIREDDDKYVQFRLMNKDFSSLETDWQGMDNIPVEGSENLVNSGGVYTALDGITEKVIEISDTEVEIAPNNLYKLGIREELSVTLLEGRSGNLNEYMFEFVVSGDEFILTLPSGVRWLTDPTWENGYTYQVSIVDNLAVSAGWEALD